MSDNTTLNPGAGGDVIASDDIGGVKYQRVKLSWGVDGAAVDASAAAPLPVSAADLPLPAGAATEGTLAAIGAAVAIVDSAVSATPSGLMAVGVRRDADGTPVSADGDVHPFCFNSTGRLKVSVMPADSAVITGSITANAQVVAMDCSRLSNISVSMIANTLAGHNVAFEVSNDSTNGTNGAWYGVQLVRSNANTVEGTSGVLAATPAYMWQLNVADYGWFRVRATAHTSGTAAYTFSPSAFVSEPIPASQVTGTQPVSGVVTANAGTLVTPTAVNINSLATTNASVVKASAGTLYNVSASNTGAAAAFLKLYNLTVAPTVGTSVPVLTVTIPAGGLIDHDFGAIGHRFTTGISIAITNLATDTDATAIAASQVKVLASFI